jgi:hypothetical protein
VCNQYQLFDEDDDGLKVAAAAGIGIGGVGCL